MSSLPLTFNHVIYVTPKQIVLAEFHQHNMSFEMMTQEKKNKI